MQLKSNNIIYIGVPFRSGANREGTQYAPQWLIEHLGAQEKYCSMLQFDTEDAPLVKTKKYGIENYDAVIQMKQTIRTEVTTALKADKHIVVLGGDHSIAMGSLAGVLEHHPNIGVIWFDAHTDINTEASSPSGNAHGMPLAALFGLCMSEINNHVAKLKPENVFWVGARDIDDGELETIKQLGIEDHVYTIDVVRQQGMNAVMDDIRWKMQSNGVEQMHLSFDIDGMDPLIAFATGTPVEMGVNEIECNQFIEELSNDMPSIVSMDFVEYNPLLDDVHHSTGKWCIHTFRKLLALI